MLFYKKNMILNARIRNNKNEILLITVFQCSGRETFDSLIKYVEDDTGYTNLIALNTLYFPNKMEKSIIELGYKDYSYVDFIYYDYSSKGG